MTYQLWVAIGILAAFAVRKLQPDDRPDLAGQRGALTLAAVIGAVLGAFLLELPADLLGWTSGPDGAKAIGMLGGRTVLGGLIGGWVVVELLKWRLGIRGATGDAFAAPLAVALACGRMGCAAAGCCAGSICPDGWWATSGTEPRWPVQLIEVAFHAAAAGVLLVAAWRGWWAGRRLAGYLAIYAVLRFLLEFLRTNPPAILGLTWYQLLAGMLFMMAAVSWVRGPWSRPGSCG
ncbi:hypothetical protein LBMAG53_07330 [Planctomycetota bacterium]|nr:hypothetical protein LBMAG53_07330 [Planctomycetota bacterium]